MIRFYLNRNWLKLTSFLLVSFANIIGPSFALSISSSQIVLTVQTESPRNSAATKKSFSGNVSWYGPGFNGKKTASGEIFDMNKQTAAHLKLPFGTRVLVEDPKTGNTVIVKVNDRGPYVKTRVMDLSKGGAKSLGTLGRGVAYVDCLIVNN